MKVYEKLQKVKVILMDKELKKTGKNTHRDFTYYELSDFLPITVREFEKIGLCSWVSFDKEVAMLTIIDSQAEPEEKIIITSPMAEGAIPGCTPMQNLGGVQTYQRRYLYMSALDIVEQDTLDPNTGKEHDYEEPDAQEFIEDFIYVCEDCGQEITATSKRTKVDVLEGAHKYYKRQVCGPCMSRLYKEKNDGKGK